MLEGGRPCTDCGVLVEGTALYFGGADARQAVTADLDLRGAKSVHYSYIRDDRCLIHRLAYRCERCVRLGWDSNSLCGLCRFVEYWARIGSEDNMTMCHRPTCRREGVLLDYSTDGGAVNNIYTSTCFIDIHVKHTVSPDHFLIVIAV